MSWRNVLYRIIVDRVVIVVLVAILLGGVEYRFSELQKRSDARNAVSTVMTSALVQQSGSLMVAVESYMLLVDNMIETNLKSDPELSRLEHKIRLAVRLFAAVSPDVAGDAKELEASMTRLSNFVRGDRQTGDDTALDAQNRLRGDFLDKYVAFTGNMRTVTRQAVELELEDNHTDFGRKATANGAGGVSN